MIEMRYMQCRCSAAASQSPESLRLSGSMAQYLILYEIGGTISSTRGSTITGLFCVGRKPDSHALLPLLKFTRNLIKGCVGSRRK